jgi:hypothetical protein
MISTLWENRMNNMIFFRGVLQDKLAKSGYYKHQMKEESLKSTFYTLKKPKYRKICRLKNFQNHKPFSSFYLILGGNFAAH